MLTSHAFGTTKLSGSPGKLKLADSTSLPYRREALFQLSAQIIMGAERVTPHCDIGTLPSRRKCWDHTQSKFQTQGVIQDHDIVLGKQQMGGDCSLPAQTLKYWLAASFCLNALCLSIIVSFVRPASDMMKQGTIQDRGRLFVNGAGKVHVGIYTQHCSGQGHFEYEGVNAGQCRCYSCFTGSTCSELTSDCTVNFDHGDPKMFEMYWSSNQNAVSTVLLGGDRMSYFSYTDGICWFLEPSLAAEIKLMHKMVGNAVTDGYHIVVGTGSSQLISAALYALSSSADQRPVDVVSAAPFYSSYPPMTDLLKSQLHQWAGDALSYKPETQNMYIELVTSPGNPDGMPHYPVVNGTGPVIYDLAYYWPHYTPIIFAANYEIMLFTISKSTGHAGTRIGWALVRDAELAKRMTKYIELSTIGVSKDSQFRASQILKAIRASYSHGDAKKLGAHNNALQTGLFDFGYKQMDLRWEQVRRAVQGNACFSLEIFPSAYCNFFGRTAVPHPAFAWLRCEKDEDCHLAFKANGILTRSGIHFGSSPKYVRISMVDHDKVFQLFIDRLQRMADACHITYQQKE